MKEILLIVTIYVSFVFGNDNVYMKIDEQLKATKNVELNHNSYKIITFNKRIKDIRLSRSSVLSISFEENREKPLSVIKVFAKTRGSVNALITFDDDSLSQITFRVKDDFDELKMLINEISKDLKILRVKDNFVIKGKIKNNKQKSKIIELINAHKDGVKIIDLTELLEPDKMIKIKLYVVELNNNKGETLKNNWSFSGENPSGTNQIDVSTTMLNAVTLSGGLTLTANRLGSLFNTGLTLNYLKSNGVAKILDETTLLTIEQKASEFLAGGKLNIQTATTSSEGLPVTEIQQLEYGLILNVNVKEIISDEYIKLQINTKSSTLDQSTAIGGIPSTKEKEVKTNVVVKDKNTIILGGLISNEDSRQFEKTPFLGDIPILGSLFKSKDFQNGNSELIFFITPEIVNPAKNNQDYKYTQIKREVISKNKKDRFENIEEKPEDLEKINNRSNTASNYKKQHEKRMKDIFGIE
jgi:pilus assembly protein CpaC